MSGHGLAIGLMPLLLGCTLGAQNVGVTTWEEDDECGFRVSGIEHQTAAKPAEGCIRWAGDKCTLHYGDDCELKE